MQFDLSSIMKGTPCCLRHAAVAKPDGPAPTIIGPLTQMQRGEIESCWLSTRRNKFSIERLWRRVWRKREYGGEMRL